MENASRNPSHNCSHEEFTSLLDKGMKEYLSCLVVRCTKGKCTWNGELKMLDNHYFNQCPYSGTICLNGCGQAFPLQTRECPQRPLQLYLETFREDIKQQVKQEQQEEKKALDEKLQTHAKQLHHDTICHSKKFDELQQNILQQEKKHENDVLSLQQQLEDTKKQCKKQQKKLLKKQKEETKYQRLEINAQLLEIVKGNDCGSILYIPVTS